MSKTDFLFARPSFLEGMARSVDLFGMLQIYNLSDTPQKADKKALYSDFCMIGSDISLAIEKCEVLSKNGKEKNNKQIKFSN